MKQTNSTAQARETAQSQHHNPLGDTTNHIHNTSLAERVVKLEEQMKFVKLKVKNANQQWYSEKRRNGCQELLSGPDGVDDAVCDDDSQYLSEEN